MSGNPFYEEPAPEGVAFLLIETIYHQRVGFGRRRPKPFCYIGAPVCPRQTGAVCYRRTVSRWVREKVCPGERSTVPGRSVSARPAPM